MKRNISNICLILLPIVYIIIYELFLFSNYMKHIEFITAAFMICYFSLSVWLLGFRKNKETVIMKDVKNIVIIYLVLYFVLTYGLGIFFGFLENSYSLSLVSIINNTFPVLITYICIELFRYIFISANKDKNIFIVLITVVLIIFEALISIRLSNFVGLANIFKITAGVILPIIMKNIMLSYFSYNVGYQTTLLYRIIMDMYVYIMPIFPDLGEYINSVLGIGFPFLLYFNSSKIIYEYNNNVEYDFTSSGFEFHEFVIIGIVCCVVLLCSKVTPWFLLGIGSSSMNPTLSVGDAVLIKKINNIDELEKGDIIVFKKDGSDIIHRFIEISEENNEVCYVTKGDANNTADMGCLKYENIEGIVKLKVPYIAYPKLYFSKLFK